MMTDLFVERDDWREVSQMELEVGLERLLDVAKAEYLVSDSRENFNNYMSIRKMYLRYVADKAKDDIIITNCYECEGIYFYETREINR